MRKKMVQVFIAGVMSLSLCVPHTYAQQVVLRNGVVKEGGVIKIMEGASVRGTTIGVAGSAGFGVGVCPDGDVPIGMRGMKRYTDIRSNNYGNYTYTDGSVMVFVPKFYYKIGAGIDLNGLDVNLIDVKGTDTFSSTSQANAAGYALHRAFIDGGREKSGFFVDKYKCSNNGGVASSIQNGNPLSTAALHNPINALTVAPTNNHAGTIDAAKGRGAIFNVSSRFIYAALAILSMAHGQGATSADNCAWYDAGATTNFPKGCNNNARGDVNDGGVSYTSDGYSNCGKTGSGMPFAKTTHNGQNNGVADLNGLMWEFSLGLTRPGTDATDNANQNDATAFYILKESVALKDLTSGWHSGTEGANYEAWGDADHLALYYYQITISQIESASTLHRFGNGANQVLSEATSGTNWLYTGLGLPKDDLANSAGGNALFGTDYFYESQRANLAVLSCGRWNNATGAGMWQLLFSNSRSSLSNDGGFRAACYPD